MVSYLASGDMGIALEFQQLEAKQDLMPHMMGIALLMLSQQAWLIKTKYFTQQPLGWVCLLCILGQKPDEMGSAEPLWLALNLTILLKKKDQPFKSVIRLQKNA